MGASQQLARRGEGWLAYLIIESCHRVAAIPRGCAIPIRGRTNGGRCLQASHLMVLRGLPILGLLLLPLSL